MEKPFMIFVLAMFFLALFMFPVEGQTERETEQKDSRFMWIIFGGLGLVMLAGIN